MPRYFIYAIIAVKLTTMYDKIKQLVSINNIYNQIVLEQRNNFRSAFNLSSMSDNIEGLTVTNEEMMQDLLTRKMLYTSDLDSPDSDLENKQIIKPML